jgi:L-alanine-DL-glutamate epimerase-like enolase superfamily enzyme
MTIEGSFPVTLTTSLENWPMSAPLKIAGHTFRELDVVVVTLKDGVHVGRGEATGVFYLHDLPPAILAKIETVRERVEQGMNRHELRALLPPCGARNAIDCALWDLESQRAGKPVWMLAGISVPRPLLTTFTLGADTPAMMAQGARGKYSDARAIKLKLLGDGQDAERIRAVRAARADVWLGVDGNQGLTPEGLAALLPTLVEAGVELIEQPCKVGEEPTPGHRKSPIPLAADESVQSLKDLEKQVGRFDFINIKLDKCGGLTEALMMVAECRRLGLRPMVGTMAGTSLAMTPALLVGQQCDLVDLDGPLFLARDRSPAVTYNKGLVSAPDGVWGWSKC